MMAARRRRQTGKPPEQKGTSKTIDRIIETQRGSQTVAEVVENPEKNLEPARIEELAVY
jgi:hypothetical protein